MSAVEWTDAEREREREREAILNAVAAALDSHKYALYGVCACGLDLGADHGRYQEAWRGHLAHEQTEAVLAALAPHVGAMLDRARAEAQESVKRAIRECHDDPAKAVFDADRLAGEAIIRAHAAEGERDQLHETLRLRSEALDRAEAERDRLEGEVETLRARLAAVEALADEWEREGLRCTCGHGLDQHNGLGCYARLAYQPELVTCPCDLTDDRHETDFAVADLRALLEVEP